MEITKPCGHIKRHNLLNQLHRYYIGLKGYKYRLKEYSSPLNICLLTFTQISTDSY